jgi:hypothetical protein
MGAQQILMIVVGVIIVGIAVAVGFYMFGSNAYSANRSALAAELQTLSTPLLQFWKLPSSMGGANSDTSLLTMASVGGALGFSSVSGIYSMTSGNGEYRILSIDTGVIEIGALGTETKGGKHPYAVMTVDLLTGEIETAISEATGF